MLACHGIRPTHTQDLVSDAISVYMQDARRVSSTWVD